MTNRGAGLLGTSFLLAAVAWLLGYPELAALAAGCLGVVLVAWAMVAGLPVVVVERTVRPARAARGEPAGAVVTVTNVGRRAAAAVRAHDVVGGTVVALDVPRIAAGSSRRVEHRLDTSRRGVVEIGPLMLEQADPWGVFRRRIAETGTARLVVRPRVHPVPLPRFVGQAADGQRTIDRDHEGATQFHALRDYVVGDELRHIHWRSSAKAGRLMVKQMIDTTIPGTLVVLDVDPYAYVTGDDFEEAVDVAASFVVTSAEAAIPTVLRTTAGEPPLRVSEGSSVGALLDALAEVSLSEHAALGHSLPGWCRAAGSGAVVVVTGRLTPAGSSAVAAAAHVGGSCLVVRVPGPVGSTPRGRGVRVVDVRRADDLVDRGPVRGPARSPARDQAARPT